MDEAPQPANRDNMTRSKEQQLEYCEAYLDWSYSPEQQEKAYWDQWRTELMFGMLYIDE